MTVRESARSNAASSPSPSRGTSPPTWSTTLLAQGINVSFTTVHGTRLDMEARGLTAMVRASVHYYNSEDEIERFCAALPTS